MDEDLEAMSREQLTAEVARLRAGIREDHGRQGHDLCWHKTELWSLVPGLGDPSPAVPERREFIRRCELYRDSFEAPKDGPNLSSTIGMWEMEVAVSRLCEKRERLGIELLCRVTATWEDMVGQQERNGLLQLLCLGWMEPNYVNYGSKSEFFLKKSALDRVRGKLGDQPWLRWKPQFAVPAFKQAEFDRRSDLDYSPVNEGCRIVRRLSPDSPLAMGNDCFSLACDPGLYAAMSQSEIEDMSRLGWSWHLVPDAVSPDYPSGAKWQIVAPELVRGYYA